MARKTRTGQQNTSADPVTAYARAVLEGKSPAGPHVRDACKRHLADLEAGIWTFDVEAVDRAIGFFRDVLKLNGGEHEAKVFVLLPWQAFIVGSLFGWKGPDGYRRFRVAYVESGKGSGKSPLAGGIGLYGLMADGEERAEVYSAARKKDQAVILFRDAVAMVRQSPLLSQRIEFSGGPGREWNMAYHATGSFFRPISSDDGQSGPRPHVALLDEIHEHRDNTTVAMMRAGTKGRRQALIFMITNSGANRTGVCYQYHDYAVKVCQGAIKDDAFFGYVCALDEDDDPFEDEACWAKANPSLGATFDEKYLRELVTQARGMPSAEAIVRRLNFCQWTDAAEHWIGSDLWGAVQSDEIDIEALKGLPCYLGLDLSQKRDLTALAAVWKHPDETMTAAAWFWRPGDTMDEAARRDNVPYRMWADEKHLNAPPGRIIDKHHVAEFVQTLAATHDVRAMAYDQAQIDDFLTACDNIGLESWIDEGGDAYGSGVRMWKHGQGFQGFNSQDKVLWMTRSVEHLETEIINKRITIKRNPVLTWNSASGVLTQDPTGTCRKWDKRKATGRIDGMVALSMAVGAAMRATTTTKSWYEE